MSRKTLSTTTTSPPPFMRRAEPSRQITSESISAQIAAFEAAGGEVEVLSTTTVLKRIQAEPVAAKPKA